MDRLLSLFGLKHSPYLAVHKKDDDSIDELKSILASQAPNPEVHRLNDKKINQFAKNIFDKLKSIEIDSSNFELIKNHLISHAQNCQRLRDAFLLNIHDLKGHPTDISSLHCSLALIMCKNV